MFGLKFRARHRRYEALQGLPPEDRAEAMLQQFDQFHHGGRTRLYLADAYNTLSAVEDREYAAQMIARYAQDYRNCDVFQHWAGARLLDFSRIAYRAGTPAIALQFAGLAAASVDMRTDSFGQRQQSRCLVRVTKVYIAKLQSTGQGEVTTRFGQDQLDSELSRNSRWMSYMETLRPAAPSGPGPRASHQPPRAPS